VAGRFSVREWEKYGKEYGGFMSNIICGAIAVSMSLVFLLFYAIRLESIALWIIIVGKLCANDKERQ
jgi:hypothetical protein